MQKEVLLDKSVEKQLSRMVRTCRHIFSGPSLSFTHSHQLIGLHIPIHGQSIAVRRTLMGKKKKNEANGSNQDPIEESQR